MTQDVQVAIDPLDTVFETLVESDPIVPTKCIADFSTVKHVGSVLARPVAYDFYHRVERSAHLGANPFNQLADGHDLVRRDVISFTRRRIFHHAPGRIRDIRHMDEGPA